jgi:hypothetical protein
LSPTKPSRPYAFILGHGYWNDVNLNETSQWIDQVQGALTSNRPYLAEAATGGIKPYFPRLFMPPSACGDNKPSQFLLTQGNEALRRFEHGVAAMAPSKGLEFLGTWNMSIQADIPDGTHAGVRTNVLKAMMIVNWLAMLDTREFYQ